MTSSSSSTTGHVTPGSEWRQPERVFIASGLALDAAFWSFYLGAIVWWVEDLRFGPLQLVLLGTALESVLLVAEIPTGVVADRYSRKWSVVIAFLLMGSAMMLAVATTNFGVMLVSQMVFGVGWTFRSGAEVAWLTDEVAWRDGSRPDLSAIILRRHRLGLVVGLVVLTPAILIGRWSLRGLVAISGAWIIAFGLVLAIAMTDHFREGQTEGELYAMKILKQGFRATRRVFSLRMLLIAMLLAGLGSEALDRLGIKLFLDDGAFGDESLIYTGVLFFVLGLLGAAVVWLAERSIARGINLALLAAVLLAISSVGAWVAALAPVIGIAVGMAIQDPCREALDPVATAWGNAEAPDESRATVLSFISQAHGVGEAIGGPILASLAEAAGVRPAIAGAAVLWAIGAIVARAGSAPLARAAVESPAPVEP